MKSLGATLKESRDATGLTLREVEEKTGLSNAYMSQLENDKIKKPSANVLYKLAKLYRIKLDFLLRAAGVIEKVEEEELAGEDNSFSFHSDLTQEEKGKMAEYLQFLRSKQNRSN